MYSIRCDSVIVVYSAHVVPGPAGSLSLAPGSLRLDPPALTALALPHLQAWRLPGTCFSALLWPRISLCSKKPRFLVEIELWKTGGASQPVAVMVSMPPAPRGTLLSLASSASAQRSTCPALHQARVWSPSVSHPSSPRPPTWATGLAEDRLSAASLTRVLRPESCKYFHWRALLCWKLRHSILSSSCYS